MVQFHQPNYIEIYFMKIVMDNTYSCVDNVDSIYSCGHLGLFFIKRFFYYCSQFKRKANGSSSSSSKGWTKGKRRKVDMELLKPPKPPLTRFALQK